MDGLPPTSPERAVWTSNAASASPSFNPFGTPSPIGPASGGSATSSGSGPSRGVMTHPLPFGGSRGPPSPTPTTPRSAPVHSHAFPQPIPVPAIAGGTEEMENAGIMSPPTPAPSPPSTSSSRWKNYPSVDGRLSRGGGFESVQSDSMSEMSVLGSLMGEEGEMEVDGDEVWPGSKGKGKGKGKDAQREDVSRLLWNFRNLNSSARYAFLAALVDDLHLPEALVVSRRIEPRLKRDILRDLPVELALYCLSFVEDARTLARASQVSRYWYTILQDDSTWRTLCFRNRFTPSSSPARPSSAPVTSPGQGRWRNGPDAFGMTIPATPSPPRPHDPSGRPPIRLAQIASVDRSVSFKQRFKSAYVTQSNWLRGGRLLAVHMADDDTVVTSLAVDDKWLVMGMASSKIHLFHVTSGRYVCTFTGHEAGVWAMVLVSPNGGLAGGNSGSGASESPLARSASYSGGSLDGGQPMSRSTSADADAGGSGETKRTWQFEKQSDPCHSARGWTKGPGAGRRYLVSGGSDRDVRVWDLRTGRCVHTLRGHTSTLRAIKVLDGRPIAVSASRDSTLRVWDIQKGQHLHTLRGHSESVRCMEIAGNMVVSGSYDKTARLWDVDTGECLHVLRGHYHQIYACAFDGMRIVTGSLDSTIRIWSAETGQCLALLQGHTSLVGQLQLRGDRLVSGGSDGRVIIYDLATYRCIHRLCAHDNSVTTLQMDDRWIVSGGNDGRIKLFSAQTSAFVRELTLPCDAVWRMVFRDDRVFVMYARGGRTILEMLSFRPDDEGVAPLLVY